MKHFKELTAAVLTLLATVACAQDGEAPPTEPSDVNVLGKETFDSFVTEHPLVLAECKFAIPFLRLLYSSSIESFSARDLAAHLGDAARELWNGFQLTPISR